MEESFDTAGASQAFVSTSEVASPDISSPDEPIAPEVAVASATFVGRWNRLVSVTNWEKGRIINQWRESLIAEGCPATGSSDETWARLVGGVTGQHVGRLRRAWVRFGETREQYDGLYWSHFQAAIDWPDAEMWLEGAVREGWSVSQMRGQRGEALGVVGRVGDLDSTTVEGPSGAEIDEDAPDERGDRPPGDFAEANSRPLPEGPDFGDEDHDVRAKTTSGDSHEASESAGGSREPVRPFENLDSLPDDMADAFDQMKLAILRHKTDGWRGVSLETTLAALDGLRSLAMAPPVEDAPF